MSSTESNIYSFFKEIKNYKINENGMEKNFLEGKHNTTCNSFAKNIKISRTEDAKDICKKFKCLKNLISTKGQSSSHPLGSNDFLFLNYWLNSKLRNNTINHGMTVEEFEDYLNTHENNFYTSNKFEGKLYDIDENDLENMNLLNVLYIQNSEIYGIIESLEEGKKKPCLEHFQKSIDTYKKGIIKCPLDDANFCNALKQFQRKYNQISATENVEKKCIDKDSLHLPTYEEVLIEYITLYQKDHEKNIMSGTILAPTFAALFILIFIYSFTPFGQWIRTKIGKNKITKSNINNESDQLLLNNSNTEYIISGNNPYNISYDTLGNL
ncbi:PIR Superfamily Protein [Plasmodium ovale wallikeri]|uniref:PIR Superfamily Protein n=1 Tax=Plasmodium ovale wallikeri TaxID=864142 RepID=A0A1A9ADJ1_PLAOA|nr:PIR Superfamily Protein [Plasmodium ovale wallikeri]SBT57961.1 PIR Superfamily Protein [Plasmodium ovale wallikeri]